MQHFSGKISDSGLQTLILRCLLDTRWRGQVCFFTSLDFGFFFFSFSLYRAVIAFIHVPLLSMW